MFKKILFWLLMAATLAFAIIINLNHETLNQYSSVGSLDIDNGDSKINWEKYSVSNIELSGSLNITKSGVYHLTGSIDDGSVLINAGGDGLVKIILDNVSIKNSSGPAISCIDGDDLAIEIIGENFLEDGDNYSAKLDEDINGAIYSKADLSFSGNGKLNIVANYQDGIVGKDDIKFNSGTYDIAAADDGIRGKDSVYIIDGTFDISSKGDSIKSTNEIDAGKGFVLIEDGDITIASGDDGIRAIRMLTIKGGTVKISKSYEGLEAQKIIIDDGELSINASDDGINAGGSSNNSSNPAIAGDANCEITFNGGNISINASGDGIDSNGYIYFNGGKITVDGPTNNGNGALDAGIDITMNGGEVLAIGSSGMAETLGSESSIFNISVYLSTFAAAGTRIEIKNSNNETILSHISLKAFNHIAAGSAYFKLGESYDIYLNNTKSQSFKISDITTVIGNSNPSPNSNNNMMPPNGDPGGRR